MNEKYLEITAEIVLEAIRSGKYQNADAQTVADYFKTVYMGVAALSTLDKTDVENFVRNIGTKKHYVSPEI